MPNKWVFRKSIFLLLISAIFPCRWVPVYVRDSRTSSCDPESHNGRRNGLFLHL